MASDEKNPNSQRIDAAIAEYLEMLEKGGQPDQVAFLARHAAIANELSEFIAEYSSFKRDALPKGGHATTNFSHFNDDRSTGSVPIDEIRYFGDYELLDEIAARWHGDCLQSAAKDTQPHRRSQHDSDRPTRIESRGRSILRRSSGGRQTRSSKYRTDFRSWTASRAALLLNGLCCGR